MSNFWWCAFWFCLYALGLQAYQDGLPAFVKWISSLPLPAFFIIVSFFSITLIIALAAAYKSFDEENN